VDLHSLVRTFHDEHVTVSKFEVDRITSLRDTVKARLIRNLALHGRPKVQHWISQGSYAMSTMVKSLKTGKPDMDLDIGIVFKYEDLMTGFDTEMKPNLVKRWVADALMQGNLISPPQVRKNCVTVWYESGEQIDIPVYRRTTRYQGDEFFELASSEWIVSDPTGVNDWFRDMVGNLSPEAGGSQQLRRLVRLFKVLGRHQTPKLSGFAITALVVENYKPVEGRDDHSFFLTAQRIVDSLTQTRRIYHPVLIGRRITKTVNDTAVVTYRDRLKTRVSILQPAFTTGVTYERAIRAWAMAFPHPFFRAHF